MTNMALGYYKTGGDMDAFFGKAPAKIPVTTKDISLPGGYEQDLPYRYEKYGQRLQDKWTGPGRGTDLSDYYRAGETADIMDPMRKFTGKGWEGFEDIGSAPLPRTTQLPDITKEVWDPINQREIMAQSTEAPLAGMGLQKRIKTKPSFWETKGMPEGMTVGSPAYDEFYGIGKEQWDPMYVAKSAYDLMMTGGPTEEDRERERRKRMEQFREDLMWRPDAPNYFDDFFLGNRGGIASLAHGGRIGYQGGGPAGMSLEELKKQIFSKYMTTNYGDDQMAMDPEGAGSMTPPAPIDFDDDFRFDEGTIGPNPTFEDEFGGYLDLASGPGNQGLADAYDDYKMNGGTLDFEDWKISIDEVMNPEDWAAARGGRMGYQGGGELNAIPGGAISGPGTGISDSIPAKLSNNEFVFTENAVKAAGGGDVNAGAQQLYGIMNALDPNSARINEPPVYS